jgi:hypothetical protein
VSKIGTIAAMYVKSSPNNANKIATVPKTRSLKDSPFISEPKEGDSSKRLSDHVIKKAPKAPKKTSPAAIFEKISGDTAFRNETYKKYDPIQLRA